MQNITTKLFLGLVLGFCLTEVQAQTSLYVKEKTGTQNSLALNSIRKLTFPTGNMIVNKNDGTTKSYALTSVRYFNFNDLPTNVSTIVNIETDNILLYPNPVNNEFKISYQSTENGLLQISIIDIQGRILQQQMCKSTKGDNYFTINVTQLPQGLYVCHIQNTNKTETIKFIHCCPIKVFKRSQAFA